MRARTQAFALALAGLALAVNTVGLPGVDAANAGRSAEPTLEDGEGTLAAPPRTAAASLLTASEHIGLPGVGDNPSTLTVTSPKGKRTVTEGRLGVHDIPSTALRAYERAAAILSEVDPTCRVRWTLLAAIGRVESDHGRYAGAHLATNGVSSPLIIGVPLNGVGPVARIRDTDNGRFDRDRVWDRAVGPMQFIATTWSAAGVDGDGDGERSPNDIDDAALASAVYLCADTGDVGAPGPMRASLLRYNNSRSYVSLVMAYERLYRTGDFTITAVPRSAGSGPAPLGGTIEEVEDAVGVALKRSANVGDISAKEPRRHGPGERQGSNHTTAPSKASDRAPTPGNQPQPTPSEEPRGSGEPPGGNAEPPDSDPPRPPPPDSEPKPDPPPDPEPIVETGVWEPCDVGFCLTLDDLSSSVLDLGLTDDVLATRAAADFDADDVVEDNAAEFAGLEGSEVSLLVVKQETGWVIYTINDYDYRLEDGSAAPPAG